MIWRYFLLSILFLIAPRSGFANDRLDARITAVTIPSDGRPIVTFTVSDDKGNPLEMVALDRERLKFTIAAIQVGVRGHIEYQNYILTNVKGKEYVYKNETRKPALAETLQPDFDYGGALRQVRAGIFTYTFKRVLPANHDRRATHVVGGEISTRNGKYSANPLYEFVPAGGMVRAQRAVLESALCNNCHDPLKYHGQTRREVGYCVLCHTSQLSDPESGESLDFKVFIHKIHRGKLLPSVRAGRPFFTVGENQSVADFSSIRYPQAILSDGAYKDFRNCGACHTTSTRTDHWKKFPSIAACTSCHNNVDLATGQNHKIGPAADNTCFGCHPPEGPEFGPSITGAHTFPGNSAQLPGVVFDILKIADGEPGKNPVITFSVKTKSGEPLEASKMPNLRLVVAWPTIDYKVAVEEDARKARALEPGVYSYKFNYSMPADALGSGAVGIQGFTLVDLQKPNGDIIKGQRDVGFNVVKYFSITDRHPISRRKAVKVESCNACHLKLATHGEARRNTEFCVMCHNASQTDGDKRRTAKGPEPPENVHYKRLIHRIHTGANLGGSWIVYGGTPAKPGPIEFGDIRFPGDRRNCVKCHLPGANEPPLPPGLLPTMIPEKNGGVKVIQPISSACIACHTGDAATLHIETMTTHNGQEACVTCHATGRMFSVEKVHQR